MNRFENRLSSLLPLGRQTGASACGANATDLGGSASGVPTGMHGVPAALGDSMPGQVRELATLMYRIAYEAALSQVEHEANLRRLAASN